MYNLYNVAPLSHSAVKDDPVSQPVIVKDRACWKMWEMFVKMEKSANIWSEVDIFS